MDSSIFSFIMALLWCSIFVLIGTILRHKPGFVLKYGINFIMLIMVLAVIRMLLPFEMSFALVIPSNLAIPSLQQHLRQEVFLTAGFSISRFDMLLTIWAAGTFLYLLSIAYGIFKINKVVRRIPAQDNRQPQRLMEEIANASRPGQKFRIIVSKGVESPMLIGYFTPTVLLPAFSLSDEEMRYVLLHEWNHFIHRHLWIKLFFSVLCALLWWNPLVYLLKKDMDHMLEVSCDRLVVKGLDDAQCIKYVESTANVMRQAESVDGRYSLSSIGFLTADPDRIVQRCELVLFPPKDLDKSKKAALTISLMLLVLVSYAFVFQPFTPAPKDLDKEYIVMSPETAYLSQNPDGTYKVFFDGKFLLDISTEEKHSLPYSNLPIK